MNPRRRPAPPVPSRRLPPGSASLAVLLAVGALIGGDALAQARIPRTALPGGPAGQPLAAGSATLRQPQVLSGRFADYKVDPAGNRATVTQQDAAGILRWGSFDIGADARVDIVQPSASAVLLNKVEGGAWLNRTTIEGMLKANGQVYIVNPNGIVFGRTARVDVGGLLASTLNIDNGRFLAGILAPSGEPILAAEAGTTPGNILVEGARDGAAIEQARITAAGGRILLAAPEVVNQGQLSAPDGQVVLAAGGKVYLGSGNLAMRGLLVEVNNAGLAAGTSTATNDVLGRMAVGRGNATIVGHAVNQMGVVSATTSVDLNGSIYLRARDGGAVGGAGPTADRGGNLVLGAGSETTVAVDVAENRTAPKGTSFKKSAVDLAGQSIRLDEGARVTARGGEVTLTARANPLEAATSPNTARVDLAAGSVLDASGSTGARLAMESNVIEVELRGTELADNLLLRNSPLRGQKLRVDIRKGTAIANISGWLDLVEENVGQKTAAGGRVSIVSEGDVIQRAGSRIDVSGGSVDYDAGHLNTSKLSSAGSLTDVGSAKNGRLYDGVVDVPDSARTREAGYRQGYDAGSIQVVAPRLALRGAFAGRTVPGARQREVGGSDRPLGGELVIGHAIITDGRPDVGKADEFGFLGNIDLGGNATAGATPPAPGEDFDAGNPDHALLAGTLELDPATLAAGGIRRVQAFTKGDIRVSRPVDLAAGGSLTLGAGNDVRLDAGFSAAGGTLVAAAGGRLEVGEGTRIDLAGRWVNDRAAGGVSRDGAGNPVGEVAIAGGRLDLSATDLRVGSGTAIDVSGGAWLNAAGSRKAGAAGSVTLDARGAYAVGAALHLPDDLDLRAYGLEKGGKLRLTGRHVSIGGTAPGADGLSLPEDFFGRGGFASYDIRANGNLEVAAGVTVRPRSENWVLERGAALRASGAMAAVAAPELLPLAGPGATRTATSLSLRTSEEKLAEAGRLVVGEKAAILADPGAALTLLAGRQLTVDGTLEAPAGSITLGLTPQVDNVSAEYRPEAAVWLGDHARLLARGSAARLYADGSGYTRGDMLAGGSIRIGRVDPTDGSLTALAGTLVAEAGATLDVSGATSAPVRFRLSGRGLAEPVRVGGAAGGIELRAREGILFDGTLQGQGGEAAAGGALTVALDREGIAGTAGFPTAERTLNLVAARPAGGFVGALRPDAAITGREGQGWLATGGFSGGGFSSLTLKSQDAIVFDLAAGALELAPAASLVADAPVLRAANAAAGRNRVSLAAPYAQLGSEDYRYQAAPAAVGGTAELQVTARVADLIGHAVTQGFGRVDIDAAEDLRLVGRPPLDLGATPTGKPADLSAPGSFTVAGNLDIAAARVYPTTLSDFTLAATGAGAAIAFSAPAGGGEPATPLSAGGRLNVRAGEIVQDGVLMAPLGGLRFDAGTRLAFGAHSLSSVAGDALIPFGRVENGRDWVYDFGNGNAIAIKVAPSDSGSLVEKALPGKSITATAPEVATAAGARMNLDGGGDVYAYQFTPGPGGSVDVLARGAGQATAQVFAVLPGYGSAIAPRDWQYGQDGGLKAGDAVYLSGLAGLAAGHYTLLPAHYALLPGAWSVTAATAYKDMGAAANSLNADGSLLVAGYRENRLAGSADARWSGFLLTSSAETRRRSEYTEYRGSAFFRAQAAEAGAAAPRLAGDGGSLAFAVTTSLDLAGLKIDMAATPAAAGETPFRGGTLDVSAPDIVVLADGADRPSADAPATAVQLRADQLTALGAESVLLGGLRSGKADGTHLAVEATSVRVENDAANPLAGPEVILAARDAVVVAGGASLAGRGGMAAPPADLVVDAWSRTGVAANTDGALLRVSGDRQIAVTRSTPLAAGARRGDLTVAAGASLAADGSVLLDATHGNSSAGDLALGSGAALGLGAERITLVAGTPDPDGYGSGMVLGGADLAALNRLAELSLTSYSTLDVFGPVALGRADAILADGKVAPGMGRLSLGGAGIQGGGSRGAGASAASLTAATVVLDNRSGVAFAPGAKAGSGTIGEFAIRAETLEIGGGRFDVRGYADVKVAAAREVAGAAGAEGALRSAGALDVAAGRVTARAGARTTLAADGGALALVAAASAKAAGAAALGGRLRLEGDTVSVAAPVVAPSGQVVVAGRHGVTVGLQPDGAPAVPGSIDVAGTGTAFGSATAHSPGGRIVLDAGDGEAVLAAGTLKTGSTGADAGRLDIVATNGAGTGRLVLAAGFALDGASAAATAGQGRFSLDADTVDGFGGLNGALDAAGYSEARSFRVRRGDVTLAAGETMTARNVAVAVDDGDLTVAGTIDARAASGGSISLLAAQAVAAGEMGRVIVADGARLDASATAAATSAAGSAGDGGQVLIGAAAGDGLAPAAVGRGSSLAIGTATIDVSGKGAGQGGRVVFRAPRTADGTDVAIARLGATVSGTAETVIEANKVYAYAGAATTVGSGADSAANVDAGTGGKLYTEASAFAARRDAVFGSGRLDLPADTAVKLRPGIEVRSTGDLTVSVNEAAANPQDRGWNLNPWRFGGEPGVLTLRAGGKLTVSGAISDGFVKPAGTGAAAKVGMPAWQLDPTGQASWSYRLVGGADRAAADPLATGAAGDVRFAFARTSVTGSDQAVALVRTGTGRIDVAAGGNIQFDLLNAGKEGALGAAVYTAGRVRTADGSFALPANARNTIYGPAATTAAQFTEDGGGIRLAAGGDITGASTPQLINQWLYRQGRTQVNADGSVSFAEIEPESEGAPLTWRNTAWWLRPDFFNQNVATLGGGDVRATAGGSIRDLSVAAATNAYVAGTAPDLARLDEKGGGDIAVRAGGDILGGVFYVQKGGAVIAADGDIGASSRARSSPTPNPAGNPDATKLPIRPLLALGDARMAVTAGGDLEIETVLNPTLVRQSTGNAAKVTSLASIPGQFAVFSTYGADAAVSLASLAGDVSLNNDYNLIIAAAGQRIWETTVPVPAGEQADAKSLYLHYPGSLRATAFSGDLNVRRGFTMTPSAQGQLALLARGSVSLGAGTQSIVMMDRAPSLVPGIANPADRWLLTELSYYLGKTNTGLLAHTAGGLHAADAEPVRIVALDGDITGVASRALTVILPKRAEIVAGRDVRDLGFIVQHLADEDVTRIAAGRDVIDTTNTTRSGSVTHRIGGPGRVDVSAGRHIDLGNAQGYVTRGNLDNPYLSEAGASLVLTAGTAGADYAGFAAAHLGASDFPAADLAAMRDFIAAVAPGAPAGGTAEATWAAFGALPKADRARFLEARKALLNDVFFSRVAMAAGAVGGGGLDLAAFDAVIADLFPVTGAGVGNINVFGSQLKTERGGSIDLFAPAGSVFAGLVSVPKYLATKEASELGVFTIRGGEIRALVHDDVLVNQGRIFTLGGGDITLVSQYRDIDAGRGAKTAAATPPPVLLVDATGEAKLDVSGSIAGSGIATLKTDPAQPDANVYPIAPRGVFDAGDAGIRSSGTVNIVAATVLNANNIAAAGGVAGAPAAPVAPAAAAPPPSAAKPEDVTRGSAERRDPTAQAAASLTVEVLGYGPAAAEPAAEKPGTDGKDKDSQT